MDIAGGEARLMAQPCIGAERPSEGGGAQALLELPYNQGTLRVC